MPAFSDPLDLIRQLSLVKVPPRFPDRARATLWAQLDLALPGGMKDRVALHIIEQAEAAGELRAGGVVLESSSGTLAEGLARVGCLKGYRVIIVTDPRMDPMTRHKLLALGAELDIVEHYAEPGGWQLSRLRRLKERLDSDPGAFWTQQYDNPGNLGSYAHLGGKLVEMLGSRIGALVAGVGSGGSLCGTAAALRPFVPDLRVIAVDAVGSVLFNQPDLPRLQSGHSNSIVPGNIHYSQIDEAHWLTDGEAFWGCRQLARSFGVFAGGSSGAAWIVASWVAEQLDADQQVVTIFPDRGDRYHGTIYNDVFLAEKGLLDTVPPPLPKSIRYGVDIADCWSRAELPHGPETAYYTVGAPATRDIARKLGLPVAESKP